MCAVIYFGIHKIENYLFMFFRLCVVDDKEEIFLVKMRAVVVSYELKISSFKRLSFTN